MYLCAEYNRVLFDSSESTDDIQGWTEKKASKSPMFHFCKMLFDLQILILMFIRLQRERDFALYVQVLKSIMKYNFAFNHYTRWLTINVGDLMKLELVCPNVYKEFCSGNFFVRKTINPFSAIALDQAHEQCSEQHMNMNMHMNNVQAHEECNHKRGWWWCRSTF